MGYQLENHMRCVGANNFMIDNWQQTRFWNIRFNLNLHLLTLIFLQTFFQRVCVDVIQMTNRYQGLADHWYLKNQIVSSYQNEDLQSR